MIGDILSFVKNDWERIPQNYRYIAFAGIVLIINSWYLYDKDRYAYMWGVDLGFWTFFVGLILLMICFSLIVGKQVLSFINLIYLRRKYPPSKVNKDFYIIAFKANWYLFDKKKKKVFHVKPWGTVLDLRFEGLSINVEEGFIKNAELKVGVGKNKWISIDSFEYIGTINTRGIEKNQA